MESDPASGVLYAPNVLVIPPAEGECLRIFVWGAYLVTVNIGEGGWAEFRIRVYS